VGCLISWLWIRAILQTASTWKGKLDADAKLRSTARGLHRINLPEQNTSI